MVRIVQSVLWNVAGLTPGGEVTLVVLFLLKHGTYSCSGLQDYRLIMINEPEPWVSETTGLKWLEEERDAWMPTFNSERRQRVGSNSPIHSFLC